MLSHICLGVHVETVVLTEAAIAGGVTRTTPASLLRDSWIKASGELRVSLHLLPMDINLGKPQFRDQGL